jgi:hypothetical protein
MSKTELLSLEAMCPFIPNSFEDFAQGDQRRLGVIMPR